MGEMIEVLQAVKKLNQSNAAQMRQLIPMELNRRHIMFSTHNEGAHLIVETSHGLVDYWPGTGKWKARDGVRGHGLDGLLAYMEVPLETA